MTDNIIQSPDCRDGKCGACNGTGWNLTADTFTDCPHDCHTARTGEPHQ